MYNLKYSLTKIVESRSLSLATTKICTWLSKCLDTKFLHSKLYCVIQLIVMLSQVDMGRKYRKCVHIKFVGSIEKHTPIFNYPYVVQYVKRNRFPSIFLYKQQINLFKDFKYNICE